MLITCTVEFFLFNFIDKGLSHGIDDIASGSPYSATIIAGSKGKRMPVITSWLQRNSRENIWQKLPQQWPVNNGRWLPTNL